MRRIWCVCFAGQKECQGKQPLPSTCGRMRALGSSGPTLRLPNQKQGSRTTYVKPGAHPNPWGVQMGGRMMGFVI